MPTRHRTASLLVFLLALLSGASAAQLSQVAIIDIPGRPGFDAVAFANGQVVIAHRGANSVDIFNPTLRRLSKQISGMADPRGVVADDANRRVYVANAGSNSIAVIDSSSWQVESPIALPHSPDALLLVGRKLYVSDGTNDSISVVDLDHPSQVNTIVAGGRPEHMLFDPDGRLVFADIEAAGEVVGIDPLGQIVKRFRVAGSQPTGMAIDVGFRRLFVAVRYAVLVLNADSGAEIGRIPAAAGIDNLWFDPSGGALYAAATDGSMNLIATQNDRFTSLHELRTDVRGHAFAFDPAKKTLYLAGGRDGKSKVVILKRVDRPAVAASPPAKSAVTAEKK